MATVTTSQRDSLTRAITRRFGASMLPLRFASTGTHTVRVTDDESGSWVEGDFSGSRMRVTGESNGPSPRMVPQPAQQPQARTSRARSINDHVPALIIEASRRAHPAAAQAVRKAFNGAGNFITPDVRGFATLGGTFAAEVSEGRGIPVRRGEAPGMLYGVTVVGLRSGKALHKLSRVFTTLDSARRYLGKLDHLGFYRAKRGAILRRLALHRALVAEGACDAAAVPQARADLAELRAQYAVTRARFAPDLDEPGEGYPADNEPTPGDRFNAARGPDATAPDYLA